MHKDQNAGCCLRCHKPVRYLKSGENVRMMESFEQVQVINWSVSQEVFVIGLAAAPMFHKCNYADVAELKRKAHEAMYHEKYITRNLFDMVPADLELFCKPYEVRCVRCTAKKGVKCRSMAARRPGVKAKENKWAHRERLISGARAQGWVYQISQATNSMTFFKLREKKQ